MLNARKQHFILNGNHSCLYCEFTSAMLVRVQLLIIVILRVLERLKQSPIAVVVVVVVVNAVDMVVVVLLLRRFPKFLLPNLNMF